MTAPLRILANALPTAYVSTGVGRYVRSLYAAVERRFGDRVSVGYFDGRVVLPALPAPRQRLAALERRAGWFWRLPPALAARLRLLAHTERERAFARAAPGFHVYHETSYFPFGGLGAPPAVLTVHDCGLVTHPHWQPAERVRFYRRLLPRRLGLARRVIAVSQFTRAEAVRHLGIPEQMITVIPEAPDHAVFRPRSPEEVAAARRELDLPGRYFLFVGSGDRRKNLAAAAEAVRLAGLDIPLAAAGWAGWSRQAPGPSRARPLFLPLGYVDDEQLARLYSGAEALLFPSLSEGFGLPVLEAMACGCPVVCSRRASLPEAAGDAALYVDDPADAEALARQAARLSGNDALRREMVDRGLERAGSFTWEAAAERTLDVLLRAAGLAPGG